AGGRPEERQENEPAVRRIAEGVAPRRRRRIAARLEPAEEGGLPETQPDVEGHRDQDDRQEERDAPTVAREVLPGHRRAGHTDHDESQQQPERGGRLYPARVPAARLVRAVLRDVDRRAAVLAPQGETLGETKENEDDRGEDPDLGIRREDADGGGREAHDRDGQEERELPAREVPDAAEERCSEGPDRETGTEERQRIQEAGG